jgi:hypothetical protein
MKEPLPRGAAVDARRMRSWLDTFTGYRHAVNEARIDRWMEQFDAADRDLAARILDSVDFISAGQVTQGFRAILGGLTGWSTNEAQRQGRWRFVALSASAGESGDTMLHRFRIANNLTGRQYTDLFVYKRDLLQEKLAPGDTVVFVDDFAGTGQQVCEHWPELAELLPGSPLVYVGLVAASREARVRIEAETRLAVVPYIELTAQDDIFGAACPHFTAAEQAVLLGYCTVANGRTPRGFGDCGFVTVLAHNCPNNSIPVLHASHPTWEGLFRRHD